MCLLANYPPIEGFLTKREKIVTECLPLELHQTASYSRVRDEGKAGGRAGSNEDSGRIFLPSQKTSPGALEAPFLSTAASPNPTPHWSWTLPFHGQLAIISIM